MRSRTAALLLALAATLVGVLSGCADIPTSGDTETVRGAQDLSAQAQPEVRVVAQGPSPGDSPTAVVNGFLEASGTAEENYATARKFLTARAVEAWRPANGVTIYDHIGVTLTDPVSDRVVLNAAAEGRVDDQGVFTPDVAAGKIRASFALVREGGEWRIDEVPAGLYVSRQDFEREYVQVDNYFLARPPRTSVLIPDPVYVARAQISPTAMLESMLRGPTRWLSSVAMSAAPAEARLAEPVRVRSSLAEVSLTPDSVPVNGVERDLMLAQIVMTLTQNPEVTSVRVSAAGGPPLSIGDAGTGLLRRVDITPYLPPDLRPPPPDAYFIREGVSYRAGASLAPGPFTPETLLAELAVAPGNSGQFAGISVDRTMLWTARESEPRRLTVRARGTNLRSPSFDGDGNLWVLEGVGKSTVVRRYPATGAPFRAAVAGFEARQISQLKVAADGVRLALLLDTVEGSQVYLAQAAESAIGVGIVQLRRVGARLLEPRSVDWAEPDSLVVLAAERNAQPQPFAVALSGPVRALGPPLAGITAVSIAPASPMIATTSKKQVWRLRAGGTWFREGAGTAPTYPG